MKVYAIRDNVSKTWSSPFIMENDETAIRQWKMDCQKVPSDILGDYDLVSLGSWSNHVTENQKEGGVYNPFYARTVDVVLTGESLINKDMEDLQFGGQKILPFDKENEGENV